MSRGCLSQRDDACVHRLFEAQVARTPEATALIDRGARLTYRQLDAQANRLAHRLRAAGVAAEARVGIGCERSADMIVAVLAVLKAGGAYVPLDPEHPRAYVDLVVEDAGIELVLTQTAVAPRFAGLAARPVCVDDPAGHGGLPATPPDVEVAADSALYVLYTSGSTGRPKGVVGEHRAIDNRLRWAQEVYPYGDGEIACARTPLGFVDSVAEIFAPLAFGVPLVMIGRDAQRDPGRMLAELAAEAVTRIVVVPSLLATLLEIAPDLAARVPRLRHWFVGGEPVPPALVRGFQRALPGRKLINIYGATELSGDATYFDFDRMPDGLSSSPIGRPLRGCAARVVDEALRELAELEVGEVCVSGACLARGYLNRPELTAARFVPSPFPEGGRLYRTGDLGRRLPGGDLQYLGRIDHQVKIRGVRVELGAVEAQLAQLPGVAQAIAVAQDDGAGGRRLVAFYTTRGGPAPPPAVLRAELGRRVPDHLVPGQLVALDAFPINGSGKIDRRALRDRDVRARPADADDPPASAAEQRVARIWEAALGRGSIGRSESFHDLGGTSLTAARIAVRLRDELGIDVPLAAIFAHPTVAALTAHLDELPTAAPAAARRRAPIATGRPIPAVLPLSHHQLPFWFFHALTGDVSVVGEVFGFSAPIDVERLQQAYGETVAAFDVLWMRFPRLRPVQRPSPRRPCRFTVRDRRGSPGPAAAVLQEEADANNLERFALDRPPHVHARLVLLPGGEARLLVAIPHVAADMTSMERFRRTLEARYAGAAVPDDAAPGASLLDLVEWERGATPDELRAAAAYWRGIHRGAAWTALPARLFTVRRSGRPVRACAQHGLPGALTDRLAAYGRRHAVSLPITVIAAVYAALVRISDGGDPTLLVMLDKRDRAALHGLFASLASMMACRLPGAGAGSLDELVARAARQLLASYEHTDLLMRRPTLWNDFWADAPRALRRAVERLAAALAARWPDARLDPDQLAQYLFAVVPLPRRAPPGRREILVGLNILPEVVQPAPAAAGEVRIVRRRSLEQLLRPGDLIVGADPLLDRVLHIHLTRDEAGQVVINLYGGGLDPPALDAIGGAIVQVLGELGGGAGGNPVLPA